MRYYRFDRKREIPVRPTTSPMLRRQNSQRLACSSKIRETLANPEITQGNKIIRRRRFS
jgi:hypothetical protein